MTMPAVSEPYQQSVGAMAEFLRNNSGRESTGPDRVAEIVRELAGRDDAPLHLLLGIDAVELAEASARELAESDEKWRHVSVSGSDAQPLDVEQLQTLTKGQ
jgi:hypothetical protein